MQSSFLLTSSFVSSGSTSAAHLAKTPLAFFFPPLLSADFVNTPRIPEHLLSSCFIVHHMYSVQDTPLLIIRKKDCVQSRRKE